MRKMSVMAAVAAMILLPAAAQAQDGVKGQVSVTFAAGALVPVGGDFHEGGRGVVLGLPTTVDAKSNPDIYDVGFGWRAGLAYGVARNVELFGEFAWGSASASELSVGNVAGLDLRAAFDDYNAWGLEGGMRFHFAPDARLQPYVSALAGFKRVDRIPGTFAVPAAGVTLADTPFYDNSTVPMIGGAVGALVEMSSRLAVGFEAGVRYHTKLADIEGLSGTGLENLNDAGSRWSSPMSGVVRVRF